MEAPDKIYIGILPSKVGEGLVYTTVSKEYPYAKEYIRKDVLKEWAKDMKEANDGVCDTSYYQEFIDKLNTM